MARGTAPALGRRETARWAWRQLTSMRTALFLLLLLALAAVPGSLVPQRGVDAQAIERYRLEHPDLSPWLDRLGLFSVYTSPWFSAIYLLLMVSLVGCIVPRALAYATALRARPPRAPRNLDRLPESRSWETDADPDEVLDGARTLLRRRRARVDVVGDEVRAETGYLREAGNLVFHVCLVVVLVGVAAGGLLGYRGTVIVTEGSGFSNDLTQYDEFSSGALADREDLPPFSLTLDDFVSRFQLTGPQRGAPRRFEARGRYTAAPGEPERAYDIRVNHPLTIGGTSVFLVGQGYAPVVRVTDGDGEVAFEGAVPFLPEDGTYTSTGVVKVPEARPEQLGFQGFFLPTAVSTGGQAPVSAFPAAANPNLGLFGFYGDLGLDDGTPQSVFVLDRERLTQMRNADGSPFRLSLSPGQEVALPAGRGTVQFVGLRQFARFQISSSPGLQVPLWGTSIGVLGLILSLSIRPRRTWLRVRRAGSRTVVEVAGLDRVPRGDLATGIDELVRELQEQHPPGHRRHRRRRHRAGPRRDARGRTHMTLADYATFSNYAAASATVVLALAFLAHVAEWGFARQVASTTRRERALVTPGGETVPDVVSDGDADHDLRRDVAGRMGVSLTVLATLVLWAAVVTRGLAAERVPWGNMYEFSMAGVAVAMTSYLLLVRWQGIQWLGGLVTGFGVVVLGLSMTVYVPAGPLVPALHSYWLVIHVAAAMIAGASFLVGAATSVLYLVKARAERLTPDPADRVGPIWRLPSAAAMDRLAYRVHAFAFPIWTFGALIAGPIWAQYAWGRYWGWDPKEVWAFITWVVYAGYLHARATAGWKGKAAAILALVGFATFLFNYVGVNLFVGGLHSYAK